MAEESFSKLKVFISWSGDRSREAAQTLRDWLPSVLQNVKPYFTPDDIDKGSRWSAEIRSELATTDFGIICLTRENLTAPWIVFEAGALSKLGKSKVAPLLLDVEPAEVVGPLGQLQLTRSSKDECFKLLTSINRTLGDRGLDQAVLRGVFERWWPDLELGLKKALLTPAEQPIPDRRSERDMLEEVLERIRSFQARGGAYYRRNLTPQETLAMLAAQPSPLNADLSSLALSRRAVDCLNAEGITTLSQLMKLTPIDLLKVPNLGKRSQVEILQLLEQMGLSLRED